MACIENYFNLAVSDLTTTTHAITGLTSSSSTTNVSYVSKEASLLLAKAVHQTLLDGGYDAVLDETNYKITVLGFSFFVLGVGTSSTIQRLYLRIYTIGSTSAIETSTGSATYYMNNASGSGVMDFCLRLRGDKNGFVITYSSGAVYTRDVNCIALAKGINLATGDDAWLYGNAFYTNSYIMLSSNIYSQEQLNSTSDINLMYEGQGLNTDTMIAYSPILVWYKSIYTPSLIGGATSYITKGKYYQIGNEIFWAAGYKTSTSTTGSYSGACTLIRVS